MLYLLGWRETLGDVRLLILRVPVVSNASSTLLENIRDVGCLLFVLAYSGSGWAGGDERHQRLNTASPKATGGREDEAKR